jgi:hypothetical protein
VKAWGEPESIYSRTQVGPHEVELFKAFEVASGDLKSRNEFDRQIFVVKEVEVSPSVYNVEH